MPQLLASVRLGDRIQAIVDDVLHEQRMRMSTVSADLEPLSDALDVFLSGGKRLRAAFCYAGWCGAGGPQTEPTLDTAAMRVAASLEFLHACALVHDDVMDGSEIRRGQPAMHHRFANLHRGHSWLGSSESFGLGAAILIGDLCLSWADEVLLTTEMPIPTMRRVKRVYDEMRTELMAGQYLDLQEQARGGGSVQRARTVVRYKSAKYTIERPLHLGAALAGASEDLIAAYSAYGLPLGEAFQLRDDVLGVFGDPSDTGKPAGDDLREGKRTVLIATTFERASAHQREVMREWLGDPAIDAEGIDALRQIIIDTGALADSERLIEELLAEALAASERPIIATDTQIMLAELAYAATRRKG